MKFGKYLVSQQEPEWLPHYMDYGKLKAMLKALASTGGGAAFGAEGANERVTSLTMTQTTDAGEAKFEGNDIQLLVE